LGTDGVLWKRKNTTIFPSIYPLVNIIFPIQLSFWGVLQRVYPFVSHIQIVVMFWRAIPDGDVEVCRSWQQNGSSNCRPAMTIWGWVRTYSITMFWGNKHP
jgi:hypothetical protein